MRITWSGSIVSVVLILLALPGSGPARARILLVGPTAPLTVPSAAAKVARDGDVIRIAPGSYADCAEWKASHLTIIGTKPGVVLHDVVCAQKGIFITSGDDITIRGITFEHATAPAHNGAGIRVQGANLTIIDCRFIDNENGILTAPSPTSTLRILGSSFRGNGKCDGPCAHGIYAGPIRLLDIEHSRFFDQHVGHHVKSRALRTILIDDTIADGPDGTASYLVDVPNGGDLLLRGNVLQKGPHSDNPEVAVTIGEEGVSNPTNHIAVESNQFRNDLARSTIFVRNNTTTPAILTGNRFSGEVIPLVGPGEVHR
jgi:hypothetical protein